MRCEPQSHTSLNGYELRVHTQPQGAADDSDTLQGEPLGPQPPETVEAIDALSQLLRDGGDAATAAALRERFGCA